MDRIVVVVGWLAFSYSRLALAVEDGNPPIVTTLAPTEITETSFVARAIVDPGGLETDVTFEVLGGNNPTAVWRCDGSSIQEVAYPFENLWKGYSYAVRVTARNAKGESRGYTARLRLKPEPKYSNFIQPAIVHLPVQELADRSAIISVDVNPMNCPFELTFGLIYPGSTEPTVLERSQVPAF